MTVQVRDRVVLDGRALPLTGTTAVLFDPAQYGLTPMGHITSCHRGFVCEYHVSEDILWLEHVSLFSVAVAQAARIGLPPRAGLSSTESTWHSVN